MRFCWRDFGWGSKIKNFNAFLPQRRRGAEDAEFKQDVYSSFDSGEPRRIDAGLSEAQILFDDVI